MEHEQYRELYDEARTIVSILTRTRFYDVELQPFDPEAGHPEIFYHDGQGHAFVLTVHPM